jgi:hypothetical protein
MLCYLARVRVCTEEVPARGFACACVRNFAFAGWGARRQLGLATGGGKGWLGNCRASGFGGLMWKLAPLILRNGHSA